MTRKWWRTLITLLQVRYSSSTPAIMTSRWLNKSKQGWVVRCVTGHSMMQRHSREVVCFYLSSKILFKKLVSGLRKFGKNYFSWLLKRKNRKKLLKYTDGIIFWTNKMFGKFRFLFCCFDIEVLKCPRSSFLQRCYSNVKAYKTVTLDSDHVW